MIDLFSLSGKRFLVTGGTRGIGRAISLHFAGAWASVIANYVRNDTEAGELKGIAEREGLRIEPCRADLTSPKGIDRIEQAVSEGGSGLSGLVHCAATGVHKPAAELTLRHFDWTFELNVRAFFNLVQRLRGLFANDSSIVAVSSEGAVRSVPFYALVGASKGALESLARHLATELAPSGIRVNILAPGSVLTEAWDSMPDGEKRMKESAMRSPLKRLVTPEEVAWAAHFLCCDASRGVIGHRLVVDGGTGVVQ